MNNRSIIDMPVLALPQGIRLHGHEWCSVLPVEINGTETLAYAGNKGIVPKVADVIVIYSGNRAALATRLAESIRALGWKSVVVEPEREEEDHFDIADAPGGEAGGA